MFGFVDKHFASDILNVKPNIYVNQEVKARVTRNDNGKVFLTLKDSLVKDKLPLIKNLQDLKVGKAASGVITKISENGCNVSFYNGLFAFVPKKYMNQDLLNPETFRLGQTKTVYIVSFKVEEGTTKILCSFVDLEKSGVHSFKKGQIVDATLKEINKGIIIASVGSVPAKIVKKHISDFPVDSKVLGEFVQKNPTVKALVLRNDEEYVYLSIRTCFIEASKRGQFPSDYNSELEKVVIGMVEKIEKRYISLDFCGPRGSIDKKEIFPLENTQDSLDSYFVPHTPIMATILDKKDNNYRLSIKPTKLFNSTMYHNHTFMLFSYFSEKALFSSEKANSFPRLSIGKTLKAKVVEVMDFGALLSFKKYEQFKVLLSSDHIQDLQKILPKKEVSVRIIDIDFENMVIDVSNLDFLMKNSTSSDVTPLISAFQKSSLKTLLVKEEYTVTHDKKNDLIGFCPSKPLNQFAPGVAPLFKIFDEFTGYYEQVVNEGALQRILISPVQENLKTAMNTTAFFQLGDVVSGVVSNVSNFQVEVKLFLNKKFVCYGTIYATEAVDNAGNGEEKLLENYKPGKFLKKIKVIEAKNNTNYELSTRRERINLDSSEIGEIFTPQNLEEGQQLLAVIISIDQHSYKVGINKNFTAEILVEDMLRDIKHVAKKYVPGMGIDCVVKKSGEDRTLLIPEKIQNKVGKEIKIGDKVDGIVTKIDYNSLLVYLDIEGNDRASIHFTELDDHFTECKLQVGQIIEVLIIHIKDKRIELSTRKSRLDNSQKAVFYFIYIILFYFIYIILFFNLFYLFYF